MEQNGLHKCTVDVDFGINTELAVIPQLYQRAHDSRGNGQNVALSPDDSTCQMSAYCQDKQILSHLKQLHRRH